MDCIFVDRPKECISFCLDSGKLPCLLNKQHLKVRPKAKAKLVKLLSDNINNPDRYKTKAGELGRKH